MAHTVMANENALKLGRLCAFGSNGSGQLGLGHVNDVSTPQPVLGFTTTPTKVIVNIVSGGNHAVMLFDNGRLACTGDNSDGRCLSPNMGESNEPEYTAMPCHELGDPASTVRKVAATWSATIALSSNQLFTCGTGNSGELGLGEGTKTISGATKITNFPPHGLKIVTLAASMAHVVAVLSNGEVWGWGKGRQGQLGEPAQNRWQPHRVSGIHFFVVDAVCGKDFTCVFGSPAKGELLLLGADGKDRFGVRANTPPSLPNWKQVAASWGSIFVLLESGEVIAWGRDDHGQLPPRDLPPLKSIAAGSEHCIGLAAENGQLLAWGWGEHGNCGLRVDDRGDVKGRWNEIETSHGATSIFAGCATSFVVIEVPPK